MFSHFSCYDGRSSDSSLLSSIQTLVTRFLDSRSSRRINVLKNIVERPPPKLKQLVFFFHPPDMTSQTGPHLRTVEVKKQLNFLRHDIGRQLSHLLQVGRAEEVASIDRGILFVLDMYSLHKHFPETHQSPRSMMAQFEIDVKAEATSSFRVDHDAARRQLRNVRFIDMKDYADG